MISNYQQLPAASGAIGAETVVLSLPPLGAGTANPDQGRVIRGYLNLLTGAAVTSLTIRVRAGTTTGGALIGTADTFTIGAAASSSIPFSKQDLSVAAPAGSQYCVTLTSTGGTTTVNDAGLELILPEPYGVNA